MAMLARPDGAAIWHHCEGPTRPHGLTFVFFNPLTGDSSGWEARVAPALRERGHGTLLFDYRGQRQSPVGPQVPIDARHIVGDAVAVIEAEEPVRPVFVGLSIGGLFAAQAHLAGARARGILFVNTLREDGPRLRWLNDALYRCALTGGLRLLRDLYLPLLFGEEWLAANRGQFLSDPPYAPLSPEDSDACLLASAATADWDLPWEKLDVPTLVLTGLEDHVFYDETVVRRLAARLPNTLRVDLPGVGHLVPAEAPGAMVEACLALAGRIAESAP